MPFDTFTNFDYCQPMHSLTYRSNISLAAKCLRSQRMDVSHFQSSIFQGKLIFSIIIIIIINIKIKIITISISIALRTNKVLYCLKQADQIIYQHLSNMDLQVIGTLKVVYVTIFNILEKVNDMSNVGFSPPDYENRCTFRQSHQRSSVLNTLWIFLNF